MDHDLEDLGACADLDDRLSFQPDDRSAAGRDHDATLHSIAGVGKISLATMPSVSRWFSGWRCRCQQGVRVVDFGIRGLDLTYALLDGYEAVILVDAVPRGGTPGTLYVLEPDLGAKVEAQDARPFLEMHHLDPVKVLRLAAAMVKWMLARGWL